MEKKTWKPADEKEVLNFLDAFRKSINLKQEHSLIYLTYLLYLRNQYDTKNELILSELLERKFPDHHVDLEYMILDCISPELWDDIRSRIKTVSDQVLETILLDTAGKYLTCLYKGMFGPELATPESLADLVIAILGINFGETVYDICGGVGNFTVRAFLEQPKAAYFNKEINMNAVGTMKIRKDVLEHIFGEAQIYVEAGNTLKENNTDTFPQYDKVFGNYPWMLDTSCCRGDSNAMKNIEEKVPGIFGRNASDWLFNLLMVRRMKDSGKAVGIMTNGSTWNQIAGCRGARRYFLENGLIEAVIALPAKMFMGTAIPTTLIVFSHGNDKVKMIDASDLCVEKSRQNMISRENIETILAAYKEDGDYSVSVSVKDILEKNDTVIHPSRYLGRAVPVKDGKPLKSVLKAVYRGAAIGAKELDALLSDKPSEYQYIMVKQINDGMIDENLPYLSDLDKRYDKFLAPNHSLIISKMGPPFKCAVVESVPGKKMLINGNMFILEPDETKVNPYYLKALFESSYGTALLAEACTGSVIRIFTKKALEDLMIPIPSMEKQNKIANSYLAIQDEIRIYKIKLANAAEKKAQLFSEIQEG